MKKAQTFFWHDHGGWFIGDPDDRLSVWEAFDSYAAALAYWESLDGREEPRLNRLDAIPVRPWPGDLIHDSWFERSTISAIQEAFRETREAREAEAREGEGAFEEMQHPEVTVTRRAAAANTRTEDYSHGT